MRQKQLPALTGLRFFAALLVVLVHFGARTLPPGILRSIGESGSAGVSCFFVLSGFILAYVYADNRDHRAFYVARFARIYPIYLVGLALGVLPALWASALTPQVALAALTLTQAWVPSLVGAWNSPGWSLSAEAFFYAVLPWLLPRLRQRRSATLLGLTVLCWILSLSISTTYHLWVPRDSSTLFSLATYLPLLRLPEFVAGACLGLLFLRRRQAPRWAGLAALVAAGAVPVALYFGDGLDSVILNDGLLTPLFGVLIYALAWGRGPVAWLLSRPQMVLLGEASYALYLIHVPLWTILTHPTGNPPYAPGFSLEFFLSYLALAIILSIVLLRVVEQPARRWLRDKISSTLPALATA